MTKKVIIGLGGAVVVGGIGVAVAFQSMGDEKQRTFANPQERLQYVLEENSSSAFEAVNTSYQSYAKMLKESAGINQTMKFGVELGDSASTMLAAFAPAISDLKSAGIQMDTSVTEKVLNVKFHADVNEKEIATMNMHLDWEKQKGYLQVPELSDAYLDFSAVFTEMKEEVSFDISEYEEMLKQIMDYVPDEKTIRNIFGSCSDIFWKNIGGIQETSESIKVAEVEENCTALTMSLNGTDLYNIVDAVLTEIPKNPDLKEVITKIDADAYDSLIKEVEEISENKEELKEDMTSADIQIDIAWYVSAKNELRGVKFYMAAEDNNFELYSVSPQQDDNFAYLCYGKADDTEALRVTGTGTIKDEKLNGEYTVSIAPELIEDVEMISSAEELLKISVQDYDLKEAEKGYVNGKVKLTTGAVAMLEQFAVVFDTKMSSKEQEMSIDILVKEDKMLSLKLAAGEGKPVEACVPGQDDKVYDMQDDSDMEALESEVDIEGFLEEIADKIGISLDDLEELF